MRDNLRVRIDSCQYVLEVFLVATTQRPTIEVFDGACCALLSSKLSESEAVVTLDAQLVCFVEDVGVAEAGRGIELVSGAFI